MTHDFEYYEPEFELVEDAGTSHMNILDGHRVYKNRIIEKSVAFFKIYNNWQIVTLNYITFW